MGESNKTQDSPDPREQHYNPPRASVAEGQEEGRGPGLQIELIIEAMGLAP